MNEEIRYIELKTGYADNGPAWIGKVKFSKTSQTIYFNNKAFCKTHVIKGNYIDVETGEEYWISRIKRSGNDRHWAGSGKILIDRKIVNKYLKIIGRATLETNKFEVIDILDSYPVDRINYLQNKKRDRIL